MVCRLQKKARALSRETKMLNLCIKKKYTILSKTKHEY